jgi:hypothetical protein
MRVNKKGYSFSDLPQLAVMFVIAAIFLGIGATILASTSQSGCSGREGVFTFAYINSTCMRSTDMGNWSAIGNTAWNSSILGQQSIGTLGNWLPTIALVTMAAIIIGVVGLLVLKKNEG